MNSINDQFVFSLMIIFLGYCLKRLNLIREKDGESLSRVIFNITMPALIIANFSAFALDASLLIAGASGFAFGLLMALVGLLVFRRQKDCNRGMLTMLIPGLNVGLFALPLVEAIWGQQGILYFLMFDVGNSFIIFGLMYAIASCFSSQSGVADMAGALRRGMKSVPLLTYMGVMVLSLAGLKFPDAMLGTCQIIGRANMPLALLLLGIYLSFSFDKAYVKSMAQVLALRYVVGIVAGVAVFYLTPLDAMVKYTVLIGFLLPIPTIAIQYAIQFDYNPRFVGTLTNMTILMSFALVWLESSLF